MFRSNRNQLSRRTFLHGGVVAGGALAALTALPKHQARAAENLELDPESVVLFQGDSITDAGRNRNSTAANDRNGLGHGYPYLLAGALLADHPAARLKVFNRGISGHKVPDLDARWQQDTIDLKPSVLSILVGVNDIWHKLAGRYDGTVEDYLGGLRALLQRTIAALPETRIVVCEPFALRCGAVNDTWYPEFDRRRAAAKQVADELELAFVPLQSIFDQAVKQAPPQYWAGDGVHPSLAGHALMAKTWREVVGI